jgi:lipopolysaccharide/colanic/teichoic acid biosynthesis glycosyltransferase
MLQNSPNIGTGSLTLRNDPRVLPVGRFLRKTKLNELPQIINVLIGEMSIIGPRPIMEVDFKRYPKDIQEIIYNLKPGITGIGSIAFRDEESITSNAKGREVEVYKTIIIPYKGALEQWYQQNISFVTDLKLMFLTVWVIIKPASRLQYRILRRLPEKGN